MSSNKKIAFTFEKLIYQILCEIYEVSPKNPLTWDGGKDFEYIIKIIMKKYGQKLKNTKIN